MSNEKRMYWIRNMEALKNKEIKSRSAEYEVIADTHTVGSCTYGPYNFTIWEISIKKEGEQKKLCLQIQEKEFSQNDKPWESANKHGYYHGGGIPDELIALASLFLRRRFKLGPMVRMDDKPIYIPIEKKGIDIQLIQGKSNLAELINCLKLVEGLNPKYHLKFILAVKLYHLALQMIEEHPDMAYLNLISAIEVLCRETKINKPNLKEYDKNLALLVNRISDKQLRNKISNAILNKPAYISSKFIRFIVKHTEKSFWDYEKRPLQGKINSEELEKLLERIYDQRSRTIHNGEPFPIYIFNPPIMGSEKLLGLGVIFGDKKWEEKDFIPNLHFFERLIRHVLINFLERNQVKKTNYEAPKQKSTKRKKSE